MKLYYLGILKNDTRPSTELAFESDLSSFSRFMRGNYLEVMQFAAATVGERTKPGQRQSVEQENTSGVVHAYGRSEGICGVAITDAEYPSLVAHQVLSKIVDEFLNKHPVSSFSNSTGKVPYPELKDYIVKYQNPAEADSIMKIQNELDETKIVLHKTIQSVLERGENISKLEDQSARLSASTNMFMKQAKKQNSCCILM